MSVTRAISDEQARARQQKSEFTSILKRVARAAPAAPAAPVSSRADDDGDDNGDDDDENADPPIAMVQRTATFASVVRERKKNSKNLFLFFFF
jgi:hypothetical protein